MDNYGFYTGKIFDAHEWLGAHVEDDGVVFRTFAPSASGVVLLHKGREIPMNCISDGNFYEVKVADAACGDTYEYRIYHHGSQYTDHCDPYGFGMELRPDHKSIIRNLSSYKFRDSAWIKNRTSCINGPLNIYELHAGSWKKKGDGPTDWYNYRELVKLLIPYLKENGYNYIELLPISEHPCDESWGYQNTGFFAPTSRYGTAEDLMYMIDELHRNKIGAILDFVPVHFAVDYYGLAKYDGSALYEYPNNDVGISEWGSNNFMHSRGEVRSFLQSCANYWLQTFHFDGLRMDAISRIIYWHGDEKRGVNGNAVDFIKYMNQGLKDRNPGCFLAAEDSTNFANVTKSVSEGGLGFDYKWDMGWMHDTLSYFQMSPDDRYNNYHKLTFSMMYYYNEKFLLPLSHDEVVHGKATILQKMYGDYDIKFPQARAFYMYMMVHPGKKLNFMGNELGQFREWDEKREQDFMLLDFPIHRAFNNYIADLNQNYLSHSAFFGKEYDYDGFKWLDCNSPDRLMYSILREDNKSRIFAIFNFSKYEQIDYRIELPDNKGVNILMNSDWKCYGGNADENNVFWHIDGNTLTCTMPRFSAALFELK